MAKYEKFEAGEYVFNGKTYKLSGPQMQAMAVLTMPSLKTRYNGHAVTGSYTAHPDYYEGALGRTFQTPKIHHRTAEGLANLGLATVTHNLGCQWFEVRAVEPW